MGLTLLYSLLDAVKSKNSGLKTWFGIWNLGLVSGILAWNPKSLIGKTVGFRILHAIST